MILLTGGAGYIGSHVALELLKKGYDVVIIDNFSNSNPKVLKNIEKISNKCPLFFEGDVRDQSLLEQIFTKHDIEAVIHFAGLKAVGESVINPIAYYDVNVAGTLSLLKAMQKHNVKTFVFSSSATVYAPSKENPFTESDTISPYNPYGFSKFMVEQILSDFAVSDKEARVTSLRYFNPIGADSSGLLGEQPKGIPNNLMPYILKVAKGELKELSVFGNDYPTKDGTGVRDYIHVSDLALAHIAALDFLKNNDGNHFFNIGTGHGYSVFDIINGFEEVSGIKIPYKIAPRRPGDIAISYADPALAEKILKWKATKNIKDMCQDAWKFASNMENS
ncbi:MAG: UDP-glucose 4-epimerase GalE [Alphaproteobacteria bacterium]